MTKTIITFIHNKPVYGAPVDTMWYHYLAIKAYKDGFYCWGCFENKPDAKKYAREYRMTVVRI